MSMFSFFVSELDRFDETPHEPLMGVTWDRDVDLREDISIINASSSFLRLDYFSTGSGATGGKNWLNPGGNNLARIRIDGEKIDNPIGQSGMEVVYSEIDLQRSQQLGRPLDEYQFNAIVQQKDFEFDEQVYIGDTEQNVAGMLNNNAVTALTAPTGNWPAATQAQIIADVADILDEAHEASGRSRAPTDLLISWERYALLSGLQLTNTNMTLLEFISKNCLSASINGQPLRIKGTKRLETLGAGSTQRMVAYTKNRNFIRFPGVAMQRFRPYPLGLEYHMPYVWAMGVTELVYLETIIYSDGI